MDSITSNKAEDTHAAGQTLAAQLGTTDTVLLEGDLGAGKTEFVKGLIAARGSQDIATSPTFALLHEYQSTGGKIIHADLYRIASDTDIESTGLPEYIGQHLCLIEWPERLQPFLPQNYWRVHFDITGETSRRISLEKISPHHTGRSPSVTME